MNHNCHGSSEDKTQDKSPFNVFILDHKQLKASINSFQMSPNKKSNITSELTDNIIKETEN